MDVSGKRHATAAVPKGKDPDTHLTEGWVGPREGLDVLERVKSLLHSGFWTRLIQPVYQNLIRKIQNVYNIIYINCKINILH
jgi:hypothetical protein